MGKHTPPFSPSARGRIPDRAWAVAAWVILTILWAGLTALVLVALT